MYYLFLLSVKEKVIGIVVVIDGKLVSFCSCVMFFVILKLFVLIIIGENEEIVILLLGDIFVSILIVNFFLLLWKLSLVFKLVNICCFGFNVNNDLFKLVVKIVWGNLVVLNNNLVMCLLWIGISVLIELRLIINLNWFCLFNVFDIFLKWCVLVIEFFLIDIKLILFCLLLIC